MKTKKKEEVTEALRSLIDHSAILADHYRENKIEGYEEIDEDIETTLVLIKVL